jgi:hypothetical protein
MHTRENQKLLKNTISVIFPRGNTRNRGVVFITFYIYNTWQINKLSFWYSLSHLCTPLATNSIKWKYTCMQRWNYMEELLSLLQLSAHYFQTLYKCIRSEMLMRTERSVDPRKGRTTNPWRYDHKQPPSSEYRPSSSGSTDQHTQ